MGHADGDSWRGHDAARARCRILAADGLRHRVDERCRSVGGKPARRLWPGYAIRRLAAVAGDRRLARHRPIQNTLRWSGILPLVLAIAAAASTPVPDVLIAADGRS